LIEAWRIAKTTDIRKAFSGEGSRLYGGRWNNKGIAIVYAAATRSLAMLEILVHMRNTQQTVPPIPYMLFPASFDERLIEELPSSSLPADWDLEPPTDSTKSIGDEWVSAASSPVLSVPSVIVPEERNYILNPGHNLFAQIQFGSPVPCKFDPRLL
jgi:RES domain-containing protein